MQKIMRRFSRSSFLSSSAFSIVSSNTSFSNLKVLPKYLFANPGQICSKSLCHTPASFSNSARPEFTDVGKLDLSRPQQTTAAAALGNYWKRANVMLE